jgi:UDP-glucuronate 4-epimerase
MTASSKEKTVIVTGSAGFIGFHTAMRLLREGYAVVGIDNVNAYYSQKLKRDRLAQLAGMPGWTFHETDLTDRQRMAEIVRVTDPHCVVHLAAQAGVRWSIENPWAYLDANITSFLSILEACRHQGRGHLVYASSSSVYGANTRLPFAVGDTVDHPISLYAATKKANELMAHTYSHLYGLPTTGLRFFTVYGPWGRPDMAMWKFTAAMVAGTPIELYNHGQMRRDFTYVDDVVESITRLVERPATPNPGWSGDTPDPATSKAPWRVYNIGNHTPVEVRYVLELLEKLVGRKTEIRLVGMQPGDVPATFADVEALTKAVDFHPSTPIETGVANFVQWYQRYHEV